ncbi:MAG: sulfite oxidase-like oxidoreductase [Candidatus Latescibacterota bacterium]|nr:sulfite oxidase-like oxidoreductase [Candidatus Latescibacterota bacterium]
MDINPEERVDRLKRANPRRVPDEDPKDRIPPGQYLTEKFPVLTKGPTPNLHLDRWRFRLFGNVANDVELTYSEFLSLPQITITTDFHCVTRWSMLDSTWMGVHISEVLKKIDILSSTRFVMIHGHGQYTTNLPLADLLDDDVLFAHSWDGEALSKDHGGPLRLVVPKLYAWKSAKWVKGLEFMEDYQPGFWEQAGYHDRGDPWKEERFS